MYHYPSANISNSHEKRGSHQIKTQVIQGFRGKEKSFDERLDKYSKAL
jgi:hypothetical protein